MSKTTEHSKPNRETADAICNDLAERTRLEWQNENSIYPAFSKVYPDPATIRPAEFRPIGGLTKRELFAAMAMMAVMRDPEGVSAAAKATGMDRECAMAAISCEAADALLAELDKRQEP